MVRYLQNRYRHQLRRGALENASQGALTAVTMTAMITPHYRIEPHYPITPRNETRTRASTEQNRIQTDGFGFRENRAENLMPPPYDPRRDIYKLFIILHEY